MNSMKNYDGVRPFPATNLLSKVTRALTSLSPLSIAGAASARASLVCLAIGTLAMLGFVVSFAAVAFAAVVFGVGILGLIGAIGGMILATLTLVSVAAILVTGSIFVPAGFLLVAGFLAMVLFSIAITIVDLLPACSLVALAFFVLALLAIFF